MQAEIITIGDELLIGQVVDTNSAYMAAKLSEWGIPLYQITSVHDDAKHIKQALSNALENVDIVLCTGGLGPTKDDITKQTFCDFFDTCLVEDLKVKAHIETLYAARPNVLNRLTATQWLVPKDCTIIENIVGTAPIMWFEKNNKIVVAMPGVPSEMKAAMEHGVGDRLRHLAGREVIIHRTWLVRGLPESALAILIEPWEDALPDYMHLAYLPKEGTIRLRLTARSNQQNESILTQEVEDQLAHLLPLIQNYFIGIEDTLN